jgi:3-deoxy-7-phosphoheptulonate synthase
MLVVMQNNATEAQMQAVVHEIENMGYQAIPIPGAQRTAICIIGNKGPVEDSRLLALDGVKETVRVTKPYKLVSRETHPEPTIVTVGNVRFGGSEPVIMAGPCAVESEDQAFTVARIVKNTALPYFERVLSNRGLPPIASRDWEKKD